MQEELNFHIRYFSDKVSRLVYPVDLLVMNPLVSEAQNLVARFGHEGALAVTGCVEANLLRSRANQKYALYCFVDALCRARSVAARFAFKDYFATNMESIFASAYMEADEFNKGKMMRLLEIWMKRPPHEMLFDLQLLSRTRAKIDPSFHYHPAPPPSVMGVTSAFPPPQPRAFPAYAPPAPVMPPPPPIPVTAAAIPAPVMLPPPQELVYDIAEGLLRKINVEKNIPPEQQLSLRQVHAMHPAFYQTLMMQASEEARHAMIKTVPPPAAAAGAGALPILASPFLVAPATQASAQAPAPQQSLTEHTVSLRTDRTAREIAYLALRAPEISPSLQPLQIPADCVPVRGWLARKEDWIKKIPAPWESVLRLFQEEDAAAAAAAAMGGEGGQGGLATEEEAAALERDSLKHSVPKDDTQKTCPLSGDEFETFWDGEKQMWMYKQAIRPDPNGPIYRLEAWLAQNPTLELPPIPHAAATAKRVKMG